MQARTRSVIKLAVVLALVILVACLGLFGAQVGKYRFYPFGEVISLGLDLRGGIAAEYAAKDTSAENFDTLMEATISTLRTRLTDAGFPEATVARQGGDRIRVEIPDVSDPEEILNIIGTPAHLEFRTPEGEVVFEGSQIESARAVLTDAQSGEMEPVVQFTLDAEATEAFAQATAEHVGESISIYLDGELISSPTVQQAITDGTAYIDFSGYSTYEERLEAAQALELQILSGALPLEIEEVETRAISATLGVEAIDGAVIAGAVGLVLVIAFMIALYRLPGVAASIALLVYTLIVFILLCEIPGIQLTLQGIAGILLGVGMAVDANVIIFERFREEIQTGRTLPNALKFGFKNALSSIVDSNVTTVIAAVVLLYFGTGTIRGFATTLLIGVLTSLFTAVFVTRFLLKNIINLFPNRVGFYTRPTRQKRKFVSHFRPCAIASALVVVVALALQVLGVGLNLGIDFTGGSLLNYAVGEEYDVSDVEAVLRQEGYSSFQITKAASDGAPNGALTDLQIRLPLEDEQDAGDVRDALERELSQTYEGFTFISIDHVSAVAGRDLIDNALKALAIAFACMLVYIAIRFDLFSGLAALAALLHDMLIMGAFMVFFRNLFQVNSAFIAAILTIVGYSINNTIIIFDRIRESARTPGMTQLSRQEIVDVSVGATLGRTLNTSITTLITLVCLFIFGVASIREFAFPLIVGMLAGTYSSVMLSGQFWARLVSRLGKNTRAKRA